MTCSCKKVGEDFLSIVQSFNQSATMNRLRTRDVPTSSMEFNEIQLFLRNAETVLAGCAEEIQRLKRLREETIRAMSNARALASPIWKLPPEILYETFAVYLGDAQRELELLPSALLIEYHSRLPSPSFCLAQVCTLWRNLIHARPSCWSSIFISMPTILKYPKRLYLLHHCISRSASMPLEFIIAHGNKADDPRDDFLIHSVYNLLLENHPRWRTFTSLVDGAQKWENYIDRWISDEELRQWTSGEEPYGSLNLCSELKVYRAEESLACPSRYNRLFSILTELAVDFMEGSTVVNLLCRVPLLEKLILGTFFYNLVDDGDVSTYSSGISVLSLSLGAIEVPKYWESLQLPCLKILELGGEQFRKQNSDPMDPEELEQHRRSIISFSEMLVTAGSILQTVKLNGIPAREAVAFLTIHPSILNLTLSVLYGDYKDICAGLDISGNGPTILPNLGSLSISFDDFDRYNPAKNQSICDAVCRLVESRIALSRYNAKGVIKLEKFALEVAFRKSQAGLDICARLLDKIAVLDEEEEHFFLEDPLPPYYVAEQSE